MSDHATEIDVAGATAALDAKLAEAAQEDQPRGDHGHFASNKPADDATPAAGEAEAEAPATSSESTAAEEATDEGQAEEPSFTHIPDEALTPELLAVKRSMQADYTRGKQEVAEYRKLAEEFELSDPAELRARLELNRQLADPSNWPALHAELTQHLEAEGLSPQAASEAAAVTLGNATDALADDDVFDDGDDGYGAPELAPQVAQRLEQMERQQAELIAHLRQRDEQIQQEARFAEVARHLTDQENQIRASHPEWGEHANQYVEAVYDLAGDSGDLSVGVARLESILGLDAARYLSSKESALRAPTPVPGAGVIATPEEDVPHTLEEGHARAMEYERQRQLAEAGL